jgi:predicted GNAT superfamily acetyltransferase
MTDATRITIRDLTTLADYQECCEIQEETWGRGFSERVPTAILRVSQKIGGVTAGAFDASGRMMGFVFGLTGVKDGRLVHWSDMLAVREEARGRRLGEQLKHYQRERVLALGVEIMYWTFDPLVARNAHLNLNRLGARASEYIEDMYGANTGSSLHGTVPTDRFVAEWDLRREYHPAPGIDLPADADGAAPLLDPLDDHGRPTVRPTDGAPTVRVQVPPDSSVLRSLGADLPLAWRLAVRRALVPLLHSGYTITRFVRAHEGTLPYYVLTRPH